MKNQPSNDSWWYETYQTAFPVAAKPGKAIRTTVTGTNYSGHHEIITTLTESSSLILRREPANQYDPNAVAVFTSDDRQIGYLNATLARSIASSIEPSISITAKITSLTPLKRSPAKKKVTIEFTLPAVTANTPDGDLLTEFFKLEQ